MVVHRGETVAPGVAVGPVHLQGYDESIGFVQRIPADQVEDELNGLRAADSVEVSPGEIARLTLTLR